MIVSFTGYFNGMGSAIMERAGNERRFTRLAGAMVFCCLLVPVAYAHHSFTAEFVADKTATLNGTITQVWFKNPHVRYLIAVKNEAGVKEIWDARGSPVVWLARKGWTKDSIKVGDSVEMYGYLGRDGIKMLSIMTVTLADGTVLVDKAPE